MTPAVASIAGINEANITLAQALFTNQAALSAAAPGVFGPGVFGPAGATDSTVVKDEIANLAIAASHFAVCYPGRRDWYHADEAGSQRMALKIFDSISKLKKSILRDTPEQDGTGFFTAQNLIDMLVKEVPQDRYDATVLVAIRSAAIFGQLAAARPSSSVAVADSGPVSGDEDAILKRG